MDKKEPRSYIFIALVAVLVVLSLVFILLPQKQSEAWQQSEASKKATTTKVENIPLVAFIGDSICAGSTDDLKVEQRWPQMVSQQLKWFAYNACVGGSGYINPGPNGKSTYKQVSDSLFPKFNPAFIVIEGGQNDVASITADMATEMSAAACDLYASIRKNYPTVKLIVMTPFFGVSQAPPAIGVQESAIKECAAKYNAKVISGVRKWLQDRPELLIADQTHPNGKGHALIAKKFVAWFKASGLKA
jgi:lysophospholipase L1-like esterase